MAFLVLGKYMSDFGRTLGIHFKSLLTQLEQIHIRMPSGSSQIARCLEQEQLVSEERQTIKTP